ncbi:acetyltransferase NSI [Micractinium conductrix]|uniref:Acetyltransferase NSI n=1 Tax=Micractinium conductrix TaxID=554055 RepID=A0A2P6VN27_9CHLO|nr:acetyltransferase NSI [Micractinium conductrix]|eukprot:PSC75498.1 acetyltransferase NSI [Micractinium conductrix]
MPYTATRKPWCCAAARLERRALLPALLRSRRLSPCAVHASSDVQALQRLPRIVFSYDRSRVGANELAGLLAHVACFAPGQSFHLEADAAVVNIAGCSAAASGSSSDGGSSSSDGLPTSRQRPPRLQPALLHGALARSLVCVAAFAEEQSLPPEALASLAQLQQPQQTLQQQVQQEQQQQGSSSSSSSSSSWRVSTRRSRPRRVLVGFARAVGDAALVATVHDVAVLPALQGLGLGQQLVERLTRQLDTLGIIDVGLLAPDDSRGFFAACSFGKDTEDSVVMMLSRNGADQRAGLPLRGAAAWIKPRLQAAVGPPPL